MGRIQSRLQQVHWYNVDPPTRSQGGLNTKAVSSIEHLFAYCKKYFSESETRMGRNLAGSRDRKSTHPFWMGALVLPVSAGHPGCCGSRLVAPGYRGLVWAYLVSLPCLPGLPGYSTIFRRSATLSARMTIRCNRAIRLARICSSGSMTITASKNASMGSASWERDSRASP